MYATVQTAIFSREWELYVAIVRRAKTIVKRRWRWLVIDVKKQFIVMQRFVSSNLHSKS